MPGPLASPVVWAFWAILIYVMLTVGWLLGDFFFLAFPIAIVLAVAMLWLGHLLVWRAIAPLAARFWPAEEVGAPPTVSADAEYVTAPAIQYPAFAHARRQCGWVHISMQVSAEGRVLQYRILEQAPAGTFAGAAARGLKAARLPSGTSMREMSNVITFVTQGGATPAWAQARLAASEAA